MSLFDFINKSKFEKMVDIISEYGIDKYYIDNFKGKYETLKVINDTLSELDKYQEYKNKMLILLTKYYKDSENIELIYYEDYDYIRLDSNITRSSYPIYCLEMIQKEDRIL